VKNVKRKAVEVLIRRLLVFSKIIFTSLWTCGFPAKKTIVIGLIILFVGAAISPTISSQTSITKYSASAGRGWSDNFDTYTDGQFLDGTPDDGGWKGWDNDPTFGAYVRSVQFRSDPHSVDIAGDSDLVHEYTGYTTGQWNYTTYQYIPSDFSGESAFILLCQYEDGGTKIWSTQLRFNADTGFVHSDFDGNELWLAYDQWIELRVFIDLDADIQRIFYDGDLLVEKSWKEGVTGGGIANIGAVDLFANFATSVYYDDMSLEGEALIPQVCCQGSLNWPDVTAGSTVTGSFDVSNCGDDGSELDWEVDSFPEWGTDWTFTPSSGTGLTPAAGWQTVQVEVTAPSETNSDFTGKVKIINSNNPADFCEIDVVLNTPRAKTFTFPIITKILERFPNAFPIIRQLIGT